MTFKKGQSARNRKLPDDHVIRADLEAGLSYSSMARKYGVSDISVGIYVRRKGWNVSVKPKAPAEEVAPRSRPSAGHDRVINRFGIPMPRIPTIHGRFEEVS